MNDAAVAASTASTMLMISAVSLLFVPTAFSAFVAGELGGVVVPGMPCILFGYAGMDSQHPRVLYYVVFCMVLGLYTASRFITGLIWFG